MISGTRMTSVLQRFAYPLGLQASPAGKCSGCQIYMKLNGVMHDVNAGAHLSTDPSTPRVRVLSKPAGLNAVRHGSCNEICQLWPASVSVWEEYHSTMMVTRGGEWVGNMRRTEPGCEARLIYASAHEGVIGNARQEKGGNRRRIGKGAER